MKEITECLSFESSCEWCSENILENYNSTILDVAVKDYMFASCDTKGFVLLWNFVNEEQISNTQKINVHDRCVLSMEFVTRNILACAQSDGMVTIEDVLSNKNIYCTSEEKERLQYSWPIINSLISTEENFVVYGGDNGNLRCCDVREGKNSVWKYHFNDSITTLSKVTSDRVAIGTACGEIHLIDIRMLRNVEFSIPCASDVISGLCCNTSLDKLVAYTIYGEALWINVEPFALSCDDRVLKRVEIVNNEEYNKYKELWRCDWCSKSNRLYFPCGARNSIVCCNGNSNETTVKNFISTHIERSLFARCFSANYIIIGGYNGLMLMKQTEFVECHIKLPTIISSKIYYNYIKSYF